MSTSYKKYFPLKALEPYVRFFYYFRSDNNSIERILPIGTTEITIRLNNEIEYNGIFLANPATRFNFQRPNALGEIIGISFQPWALNGLFRIPQSEITNIKIPLDTVLNPVYKKLAGLIKGKTDHQDIIKTIQCYLISMITNKQNTIISDAVNFINERKGQVQVSKLYKQYNISERRLQQQFKSSIGMSPKKYCLLKRFHSTITHLRLTTDLTDLALDSGYYDQAHFINDFKSFAGICPSGLLKEKNTLNKLNADAYFGS
ncbi:MAG: helix-turn-helix domain-containing protein [Ferruginibacter sp.]